MYLPRLLPGTSPGTVWLLAAWIAVAVGTIPFRVAAAEARDGGAEQSGAMESARADEYSEDEVKAAFLFHFATYAEWPVDNLDGEITFAMLRADDIAAQLERFAVGRTIRGQPVRVRAIRSLGDLDGDEVLFIGASQNRRLADLIRDVEGPTLIVTDTDDGLPDGAMINFQIVDRRVRFEIALPAVQRVGLSLSSRLLSAAMRVEMSRCYLECRILEDEAGRHVIGGLPVRTPNRV